MRALRSLVLAAIVAALGVAGWFWWFATHPVDLPSVPFEFTVHSGSSIKSVSRQLAGQGVFREGESFWILSRIVGKDEEFVLSCHGKTCPDSAYASAKAVIWGFKRVYYFAGGFPGWKEAGYPVEVSPAK